jgi:hypothetical protein
MKEKWLVVWARLQSPVVWFGLIATVLVAAQISPQNLTSWDILWANIVTALSNPYIVGLIIIEVYAYLNNPADKKNF